MAVTRGKTNPKKEKEESKVADTSKKIKKTPKDTKPKKTTKTEKATKTKKETKSKSQSPAKKKVEKAAPAKKEKKASTSSSVKGYTPEQYTKYKELLEELTSKTNDQLKAMLSRNDQSTSGNKGELVAKVADGQVLGKIPRCTKCYGGRPKFDFKSGTYQCKGYHGDEHFHFCNKKYTMDELPREEWQD